MSVLNVGLSHRSAPVSLLERVVLPGDAADKLLGDLVQSEHIDGAVILSTCNRLEVYADVAKFHGAVSAATELLARHTGVGVDELITHLYVHYEERAIQHLFAVAAGLDSMVVGESQILGQVRAALMYARRVGSTSRALETVGQQALRVGKRVHSETGIDQAGQSLVSVGLDQAGPVLGGLAGRSALVVGAGSMSALAAASLRRAGAGRVVIANRTIDRARRVAAGVGGEAVELGRLQAALSDADLVLSCTGASGLVIHAEQVAQALRSRAGAPLAILDLALPRDVDHAVRELPGVTLIDLEWLAELPAHKERVRGVDEARRIITDEVTGFAAWQRSERVAPTVVALRTKAADVVDRELFRLAGRLPDLDERTREEIAHTVRRVVDKLLHAPTVRVKEFASRADSISYADVLRELFDLDPAAVEVVSRVDPEGEPREEDTP